MTRKSQRTDAELIQLNAEHFVRELRKNKAQARELKFDSLMWRDGSGNRWVYGETVDGRPMVRQQFVSDTVEPEAFEKAVRALL